MTSPGPFLGATDKTAQHCWKGACRRAEQAVRPLQRATCLQNLICFFHLKTVPECMLGPACLTVLPFLLCFCLPRKMETPVEPSGRGGGAALADSEGLGIGMANTCRAPTAGRARLEALCYVKPSDLPSTPRHG